MDAVGADQNVGRNMETVVEPSLDMVAFLGQSDESMPEMNALGRDCR